MKRHKLSQWSSWGLWERWVLATTVAEVVGLAVLCVLSVAVSPFGYVRGVPTLIGTSFGIVLTFAQWLVLKSEIRFSIWWILANALAWFAGDISWRGVAIWFDYSSGSNNRSNGNSNGYCSWGNYSNRFSLAIQTT